MLRSKGGVENRETIAHALLFTMIARQRDVVRIAMNKEVKTVVCVLVRSQCVTFHLSPTP